MTYGAAVPRLQPRPTLDNLREPLVPLGNRPNPSSSNLLDEPNYNSISSTQSKLNNLKDGIQSSENSQSLDSEIEYFENRERSRSPSVYFDTQIPLSNYPSQLSSSGSKSVAGGKSKFKQRLHLPLGRLGRQTPVETPEISRIREDHHIHVSNPTFTRENLYERNYDAFFTSGEPVYSIEKRAPSQPPPDIEPILPQHTLSPKELNHTPRPHTVGFFHRSKSPIVATTPTSTNLNHLPPPNLRAKSVEFSTASSEVYQKGERCPLLKHF